MNSNGVPNLQNNTGTTQCAICQNFRPQPKRGLEQYSTGVLLGGVGLALADLAWVLKLRGIPEAEGPLGAAARYLTESGRRMDAETSKDPEVVAEAETPTTAHVDGSAGLDAGGGLPAGTYPLRPRL